MRIKNNGIFFTPKNEDISKALEKLVGQCAVRVDTDIARTFSRYKKVRLLREKNHLYIGLDRDKKTSIIYRPPQVKIRRNNKGFFFNFL